MNTTFYNCTRLTTVSTIPGSVNTMNGTFSSCAQLVTAPQVENGVLTMTNTYSSCRSLTTVPDLPNTVINISGILSSCRNLITAPNIPDSVLDMSNAFTSCPNLRTVQSISNNTINMQQTFGYCYNLVNMALTIPGTVNNMSNTFVSCGNLVNGPTEIPGSVINADDIFNGCSSLKNMPTLGEGIVSMNNSFTNCSSLENITSLPSTVVNLKGIFEGCSNITQAPAISANVINMYAAFRGCMKLSTAPAIPNKVEDMYACFRNCQALTDAPSIPNSVYDIGATFDDCVNLVNVPALPNSINSMTYTFYNCFNLIQAPNLPNAVVNINYAFYGCNNIITAPQIPNTVGNMYYTFSNCTNLTGDIFIYAENISSTTNCFGNTTLQKNVYIPFNNNGVNTKTYNYFTNGTMRGANYTTDGSVCGVYLKDLNAPVNVTFNIGTLTIPNGVLYIDETSQNSNQVDVKKGIHYYGFADINSGLATGTFTLTEADEPSKTIDVSMPSTTYTLTVNPEYQGSTISTDITFSYKDDKNNVYTFVGTSISVNPNTEVSYSVSTEISGVTYLGSGSTVVDQTKTVTLDLETLSSVKYSGFSASNYIDLKTTVPSSLTSFDFITKVKITSLTTREGVIGWADSNYNNYGYMGIQQSMLAVRTPSGYTRGSAPTTNIWQWLRLVNTGNGYTMYKLEDNTEQYNLGNLPALSNWTSVVTSSNNPALTGSSLILGAGYYTFNSTKTPLVGSLELTATQINIDGSTVFDGRSAIEGVNYDIIGSLTPES